MSRAGVLRMRRRVGTMAISEAIAEIHKAGKAAKDEKDTKKKNKDKAE